MKKPRKRKLLALRLEDELVRKLTQQSLAIGGAGCRAAYIRRLLWEGVKSYPQRAATLKLDVFD